VENGLPKWSSNATNFHGRGARARELAGVRADPQLQSNTLSMKNDDDAIGEGADCDTLGRVCSPNGSGHRATLGIGDASRAVVNSHQYLGTLWSISSDQALMPPLTLFKYLKPCSRRNCSARKDRTPLLQWM